MKIGVVSSMVFGLGDTGLPGYGGLEQVAWEQAKGLAAKGHDVYLFAPDGSTCPGVTCVPCGPAGRISEQQAYGGHWEDVANADKLPENERKRYREPYWPALEHLDCMVDHSWHKWAYALKAEGRLKAPVLGVFHAPVNTMVSVWPPRFPGLPPVDKPCAVCISEDQRSHFEALFGPSRAKVCYNGIDLETYKPLDVPRTNRFLFLARFSSIKGADFAIEACVKAGVGLDLIGDTSITNEPEYLAHCSRLAADANAKINPQDWDEKRIRLVGPANRGETVWWYSRARAMLHPNQRFREPFGLAPVEAQACGCPVIAFDYGAMRETVVKGESGLLALSFDELLSHVGTLRNINDGKGPTNAERERCRKWASRFSIQNMVDRIESLCQQAIEEPW